MISVWDFVYFVNGVEGVNRCTSKYMEIILLQPIIIIIYVFVLCRYYYYYFIGFTLRILSCSGTSNENHL